MPRQSPERYQLLGEIARGGMGVIIKGRDKDLGRDLAFKVLKGEFSSRPGAVQRFVEEAQVGGQLQHPGIVPIYELGSFADGRPYFAMKLVKGQTLASLLADESPRTARAKFIQIFLQIAVSQTVAYAHSRGVIHRDLKRSNIMFGKFGEVLVMDWGLGKVLQRGGTADEDRTNKRHSPRIHTEQPTVIHTARSGSGSDTAAGSVMGTPAYMSPEQAGGEIDKLDERVDVFGLGAVLCVILTGRPPYEADSSESIRLMAIRGDHKDAFARLDASGSDAELVELCEEGDVSPRIGLLGRDMRVKWRKLPELTWQRWSIGPKQPRSEIAAGQAWRARDRGGSEHQTHGGSKNERRTETAKGAVGIGSFHWLFGPVRRGVRLVAGSVKANCVNSNWPRPMAAMAGVRWLEPKRKRKPIASQSGVATASPEPRHRLDHAGSG